MAHNSTAVVTSSKSGKACWYCLAWAADERLLDCVS